MAEINKLESHEELASGLILRPADARGIVDHGWLKSAHSFSFANYYDPNHMHYGPLRVINDDWIDAKGGFPMHPHENYEIFSYVLEGALEHSDSMGNGSVVGAGGIQYMSAGTGVRHSEFNPSLDRPVRLLQIWLLPNVQNEAPYYETLDIAPEDKDGKLSLFLSSDGREASMRIKADSDIYAATLKGEQKIETVLKPGRIGWVQMAKGSATINGQKLNSGDGLAIGAGGAVVFEKGRSAEFLYFDMAS